MGDGDSQYVGPARFEASGNRECHAQQGSAGDCRDRAHVDIGGGDRPAPGALGDFESGSRVADHDVDADRILDFWVSARLGTSVYRDFQTLARQNVGNSKVSVAVSEHEGLHWRLTSS